MSPPKPSAKTYNATHPPQIIIKYFFCVVTKPIQGHSEWTILRFTYTADNSFTWWLTLFFFFFFESDNTTVINSLAQGNILHDVGIRCFSFLHNMLNDFKEATSSLKIIMTKIDTCLLWWFPHDVHANAYTARKYINNARNSRFSNIINSLNK